MPEAAKRPRGETGGKRHKRRIAHLQGLLDKGDLAIADIKFTGPLSGWAVVDGRLVAPSKQEAKEEEEERPLPEPQADYSREASPSPDEQPSGSAEVACDPCGPEDTSNRQVFINRPLVSADVLPDNQLTVAIDLHNTLDDGSKSGHIPAPNVEAVVRLVQAGFVVWICSYIGRSLGQGERLEAQSRERRELAERKRVWLAGKLGLKVEPPNKPLKGHLFLCITDRREYSYHHTGHLNGKGAALRYFGTEILIDDNQDICTEVAAGGIIPYHVDDGRGRQAFSSTALAEAGFPHYRSGNLSEAVDRLLNDLDSESIWKKLKILQETRQW